MKLNRLFLVALSSVFVVSECTLVVFAGDSPEQKAADLVEIRRLTEQIKLEPKRAFLYASRGQCYVGLEDWSKALIETSKALELQPNNSSYLVARASIYEGLGKRDLEMADLERALRISPNDVEALTSLAAFYAHSRRDYSQAAKLLTQALKMEPKSAELYALRGEALYVQGKLAEALADCNTAFKLEPGSKTAKIVMDEIRAAQKNKSAR